MVSDIFFRVVARVLQVLVLTASIPVVWAAQPVITAGPADGDVDIMRFKQLSVSVDPQGDTRPLVYDWQITQDDTGLATLSGINTVRAQVNFFAPTPFDVATAQPLVGSTVVVTVTVSFENPTPDDSSAVGTWTFTVIGVNRPPVPVINGVVCGDLGKLGTPTDRIPSKEAVKLCGFDSTDPDGDFFRFDWGLGGKSGGNWGPSGAPVLFGSEGALASFTVPQMTAPIDQTVILQVSDGLHEIQTTATAFLKPAEAEEPDPGQNVAPSVQVPVSNVSVVLGNNIGVKAVGTDTNGDDLSFNFFRTGSSSSTSGIVSVSNPVRTTSTQMEATATISSSALGLGSHSFSVNVKETGTADQFTSPTANFTVNVVESGGGGEGFSENRTTCSGNTSPILFSITPDPRVAALLFQSGQTGRVDVVFEDNSQNVTGFGTQKGIAGIQWNVEGLKGAGAVDVATGNPVVVTEFRASSFVSFSVPSSASGIASVQVTATDVLNCSTVVTFNVELGGTPNESPVAKLRFDQGGGFAAPSSSDPIDAVSRSITLDAGQSTDDGGFNNLTFSWAVSGLGASLSSNSGTQVTLTVPADVTGDVTVTLTATDENSAANSTQVVFRYSETTTPPTASIVQVPTEVIAGQEFTVLGSAESGGGGGTFEFEWLATYSGSENADVFSGGDKAKVVAPALENEGEELVLTVSLQVLENGVPSDIVTRDVTVTGPRKIFSQVAVGPLDGIGPIVRGSFQTAVALVNDSDSEASGVMTFHLRASGDIEDHNVLLDGQELLQKEFTIPAGGAREFLITHPEGSEIIVGWTEVSSNIELAGHLFFRVIDEETGIPVVLSEVPVLPIVGQRFRTAIGAGRNSDVALGMVNFGSENVQLRLVLQEDIEGAEPVRSDKFILEAGTHRAEFLPDLFKVTVFGQVVGIPESFVGGALTLEIVSGDGSVGLTILKTTPLGFPRSILPVAVGQ